MKKRILYSMIFVDMILLAMAGGEIYARVKHGALLGAKSREMSYRRADMKLNHSFIPGGKGRSVMREWNVSYDINSGGLRDREYPVEKGEGVYRILFIGDSFTEGYGVEAEKCFVKLLESKLNGESRSPRTFEVINCGIASNSPLLEYLFLKDKGLGMDPDMVILAYDPGDLYDDHDYGKTVTVDGAGVPLSCPPEKRVRAFSDNPIEKFLVRHSRYYLYLEEDINKFLFKIRGIGFKKYVLDNITGKSHDLYKDDRRLDIDKFVAFRPEKADLIPGLWQKNREHIALMARELRKKGIPFVIVTYPYALEISADEWKEGRAEYGFKRTVYPRPSVLGLLNDFSAENGIMRIDTYPSFAEATEGRPSFAGSEDKSLYYDFDGHFTEKGHDVAAASIYEGIRAMLTKE
ncbi:MAG: hypothetical protein HQL30_01975 [Candidatus Omnitrophica bacterium]|nr:hypothetical protein [Candidatus Omnitrophota bacterium]